MELLKWDNYEFHAYINEVECFGEYRVEWDDDIPQVVVTSVYNNKDVEITKQINENDIEELSMAIEECGDASYWYEDKTASLIDEAYDRMRDV